MNPYFSIIIPVYNGLSNDLPLCLESIWRQPLDTELYEVICVDDCSTDSTREYLLKEQKNHGNLLVISNLENIRQGGGKNEGMRKASGQYILFIDQDDYYHSGALRQCYELLQQTELEILCCDSSWQLRGKESNVRQLNYPCQGVLTGRDFIAKNGFALAPWRMVCKRDYLLKNKLFFQEKVRIEDIDWGCKLMLAAQRIQYAPILLVHYNRYDTQTTGQMKVNFAILRDQMFAAWRILKFSETLSEPFPPIENMWKHHYRVALRMMLGCYAPVKNKVNCINEFCVLAGRKDPCIACLERHKTVYAFLSNCAIPFYRLAMTLLTKYRWLRRKR